MRLLFNQVIFLVVVAGRCFKSRWFIRQESVQGLVAAWRVIVFVQQNDASFYHARIEVLDALFVGRVEIDVEVDEAELLVLWLPGKRIFKVSRC
jgi:hypothetical protein